jgi:hypothetical protein
MAVLSNLVGGTPSSNATVVVRVPEKLGRPMRTADATFVLTWVGRVCPQRAVRWFGVAPAR